MNKPCAGCGIMTDEIDWHEGMRFLCLLCKEKKLGRKPRQFTEQEVRANFLRQVWHIIHYWFNESRRPGTLDKMEGLAFSLLVLLDGGSMNMPAFIVAPSTDPADPKFHQDRFEDWYPPNDDVEVECDISGGLHDQLENYKPADWPKDQEPPPKPVLPDSTTRLSTDSMLTMATLFGRIQEAADRFSRDVWRSLRPFVKNSSKRGHSGMFGEVKLMVYSIAGRVIVTMEGDGASFTLVGAEDDENGKCGLHAINGSANEALGLVAMVARNWDSDKLKPDESLRIL